MGDSVLCDFRTKHCATILYSYLTLQTAYNCTLFFYSVFVSSRVLPFDHGGALVGRVRLLTALCVCLYHNNHSTVTRSVKAR